MSDQLAYSVAEAANAIRISETKMRELCLRGLVKSIKLDGRRIVPRWALEELLETPLPNPAPTYTPVPVDTKASVSREGYEANTP